MTANNGLALPMVLAQTEPGSISGHFTALDWGIVAGYFVFTTILGGMLAGKQATIRDFFLGGRKLPWYAVAGSIVATEISAVTFISVPFLVFRPGGDFTYFQMSIFAAFLSRLVVGYVLVPAYYKSEIYSPYDYMGQKLGGGVRGMTTCLFTLGGMLAQSSRVYLTAVVLELILKEPLSQFSATLGLSPMTISIWIIGFVAVVWTIMGGITTVIWTDVILFLVFLVGAMVALCTVVYSTPGGWLDFFREGFDAGKFHLIDPSTDPTKAYTIWTAVIAATWGSIAIYGTDQLMAQRMFCCRGPVEARRAVLASYVGQVVTLTVMLVGVGLFVYYRYHPLQGEALAAVNDRGDRIFPIFILTVIPTGLTGLIIAGVFAAAISSLDSILAALSQTSISAFYLPRRRGVDPDDPIEAKRTVRVSRVLIVFWGIVLCLMAQVAQVAARFYPSILDLALAMAGYTSGALLAGFLLAFLPLKVDGRGYLFSAPLSVLTVFALVWHEPWSRWVCIGGGTILALVWLMNHFIRSPSPGTPGEGRGEGRTKDEGPHPDPLPAYRERGTKESRPLHLRTIYLVAGIAIMLLISYFGYFERLNPATGLMQKVSVAWPWQAPLGTIVALVWGYLLSERRATQSNHDLDSVRSSQTVSP